MEESRELISFDLCPYVQRNVILMLHKGVTFEFTYIDLASPPEWFFKHSPLGKVPLLLVRRGADAQPTVLFESAVINEYIDEISPPTLLPSNPLERALERGWVEASGELFGVQYSILTATSKTGFEENIQKLWTLLGRFESMLPGGNYFRGVTFSLVDAAISPLFMRMFLIAKLERDDHWRFLKKTRKWAEYLLSLSAVQHSVVPNFREKFMNSFQKRSGTYGAELMVS